MSVQALTWAFKQDITPAGLKFVLVALANYASEDGYCYPSQKTLAKLTGQSERAVRLHLATLERNGYVHREGRRRPDGTFISDGFYLRQNLPLEPPADSAANTKEDNWIRKGDFEYSKDPIP